MGQQPFSRISINEPCLCRCGRQSPARSAPAAAPQLAPLGNYGGPTQTRPPLAASPAIDAAVAVGGLTTDQRGLPYPSGPAPDIGAVELQEIRVNTLADENNGIGTGDISLREALTTNTPGVAEVVRFDPLLTGGTIALSTFSNPESLGNTALYVTGSVTVDASALPGGITLTRSPDGYRAFRIAPGAILTLRGLTISGFTAQASTQSDPAATGNLTAPAFNLSGDAELTFGLNAAVAPHTIWILKRSTTLLPGSFVEIYRFHGPTQMETLQPGIDSDFLPPLNPTAIKVIDQNPPAGKAFYRFEAQHAP